MFEKGKRLWWLVAILTVRSFVMPGERGENESNNLAACVPSRELELNNFYQVKRMLGGIGHVLFSTYSKLEICKIPLGHVITLLSCVVCCGVVCVVCGVCVRCRGAVAVWCVDSKPPCVNMRAFLPAHTEAF